MKPIKPRFFKPWDDLKDWQQYLIASITVSLLYIGWFALLHFIRPDKFHW